ncbi:hypothetical protein PICST_51523 [Scheffersomyces stipitis CBS 6054]|uniref:MICOS complex subunit MIC19 n=1 Tax=Scheffersomyces stipitis (strain ATCC 58785 / CBS 6054 / NBRC 10063 / NRRL Y-11545) TaxID=322104 RepID=A3GFE1_PICST|nr:predicted protein [Scheffersomyces stipitis CBS 6054]EAZ63333.1 hypothetical protein PICST_51523 [Scheffersomyces stipitis CBS 6054]
MGSSASKPETKVFTPATPVDFSASFLAQLENSPESDYSRAQYTEKYIQEKVAAELTKLEKEAITNFQNTTNGALLKSDAKPQLSVDSLNTKIDALTRRLQDNAKLGKIELGEDLKAAREEVIKCLKDNHGKSLNCWDEVESFKKLVRQL